MTAMLGDRPPAPARPNDPPGRAPLGRTLCVVLHDVAPQTRERCETVLGALERIGDFPVTLLAVPRHHGAPRDPAFDAWLQGRAARGDDIALHGYRHLDDGIPSGVLDRLRRRVYTRGEGEFWDLPLAEAERRIDAGLAWLASLGIAPEGFVAPAWLMGASAWQAVRERRFAYTCTLRQVFRLANLSEDAAELRCQAQVYSSSTAWRRHTSVVWNRTLARLQREHAVVRLELHPVDVQRPVFGAWEKLARTQAASREVMTLAALARRLPAGAAGAAGAA